MQKISWTPIDQVPAGEETAFDDRERIRTHPLVRRTPSSVVVRFTDVVHLQSVIELVILHFAREITCVVVEKGAGYCSDERTMSLRFAESRALLLFGGSVPEEKFEALAADEASSVVGK